MVEDSHLCWKIVAQTADILSIIWEPVTKAEVWRESNSKPFDNGDALTYRFFGVDVSVEKEYVTTNVTDMMNAIKVIDLWFFNANKRSLRMEDMLEMAYNMVYEKGFFEYCPADERVLSRG